MKIKYLAPILLIVFIFSFMGCKTTTTATTAPAQTTAAEETTAAPEMTAAETTSGTTALAASDYNIGDTGPAGGFIFCINPNSKADGWQYLETAPNDFPGKIKWFDRDGIETGAIATAIGTGMSNTEKIVSIQGEGSYAAKLCNDLQLNGFSDWFLPSKDELDLMYKNRALKGVGNFDPRGYWSSSELGVYYAWSQFFGNGYQYVGDFGKDFSRRVRAIRAFN